MKRFSLMVRAMIKLEIKLLKLILKSPLLLMFFIVWLLSALIVLPIYLYQEKKR